MKQILILLILAMLLFTSIVLARVESKVSGKSNVAPQKKNCCSIQKSFKNKISLTEICIEKNQTKIEFQILIPYTMCGNTNDIGLSDENGKSYEIVSMKNIPTCPEIIQINP
ncbi:MAG TPA: hypothetical protein PLS71_13660, partial [Leptospiraceae bacterium]|nr:hypothetical protein [Leptospiraceae bacterium]